MSKKSKSNTYSKLVKYLKNNFKDRLVKYFLTKKDSKVDYSKRFATFLVKKSYPTYRLWDTCWANVWEALIDFWVKWLPTSWRDWYKWSDILDNNTNFIKKSVSHPKKAKAWAILVYDKWYWSGVRKKYGHVEVALWDWYWYWWKAKNKAWGGYIWWFTTYIYYIKKL